MQITPQVAIFQLPPVLGEPQGAKIVTRGRHYEGE